MLVDRVAMRIHDYTLYSFVRPFGCSVLFSSYDDDGPHLYSIDPSGTCYVISVKQITFAIKLQWILSSFASAEESSACYFCCLLDTISTLVACLSLKIKTTHFLFALIYITVAPFVFCLYAQVNKIVLRALLRHHIIAIYLEMSNFNVLLQFDFMWCSNK